MPVFPDLHRVVEGAAPPAGASYDLVGLYWPSGSTAEAWEYNSAGAQQGTIQSKSMPFTPSNGQTVNSEATSNPGEMLSGRTVLFKAGSVWCFGMLSDNGLTAYVWNLSTNSVATYSTAASASFDQVLMVPTSSGLGIAHFDDTLARVDCVELNASGTAVASGRYSIAARFTNRGVCGASSSGVYVYLNDPNDGFTSDDDEYDIANVQLVSWAGAGTTAIAQTGIGILFALNMADGKTFVHCVPTGASVPGTVSWACQSDGQAEVSALDDDTGAGNGLLIRATQSNFGNRTRDNSEIAQHISGGTNGVAIWRYDSSPTPGSVFNLTFNPLSLTGTLVGTPSVSVGSRLSDSASPHQVHLADFAPSFTVT